MATPKQVLKGIAPKLVLFFKTVAIYFVVFIPESQPSIFAAVLKCLPILSLMGFVLMHGMSLGEEYTYSRRILLGLSFCALGDFLLVWQETFVHGIFSFLVGQLFYISAYGFQPFNAPLAAGFFVATMICLAIFFPFVEGAVLVGVYMYAPVLMTMVWRAVARVQFFEELWTWTELCSCVGGLLFALSDSIILINGFIMSVPYARAIIMTTYYAAQFCISLSVVDSKASYFDRQKNLRKKVT